MEAISMGEPSHLITWECDARRGCQCGTRNFWSSPQGYETCCKRYPGEYLALDEKCAALTERETRLGTFQRVSHR